MTRSLFAVACLVVGLTLTTFSTTAVGQVAPASVTPADAAAFLGNWTLNVESPMGPAAIALALKDDGGKVVGEISSDMMPKTPITEIAKSGADLVLKYNFSYEGNAVPVAVTLSPVAGKINVSLDFAGGNFLMAGTATKVVKP